MNRMNRFAAVLAIVFATAALTVQADQTDRTTTRSTAVAYGDLNLSNDAGVDALYRRVKAAARLVCAPHTDERSLAAYHDWKHCMDTAVDGAVASLAHPTLLQIHQARTGRRTSTSPRVALSD